MLSRAQRWWERDPALHGFVFANFLIGLPFTVFNTYVIYQLQTVGYVIGTDKSGGPCTTYCIVPWAGSKLDLNSIILYLNAIGFGLGGLVTLALSAYSDLWSRKHLLVSICIAAFGALSIPCYWLQHYTQSDFDALTALWILFAIWTFMMMAVLSMFIPFAMRNHSTQGSGVIKADTPVPTEPENQPSSEIQATKEKFGRDHGVSMTIWGLISTQISSVLLFVIAIILSETLSGTAATSAGLLVTSVVGFITLGSSIPAWFWLPALPARQASITSTWYEPLIEFLRPLRDMVVRKNMGMLLVAYTIYVDTLFAVASVSGQLFVAEIRPGALEYSLYSLAQVPFIIGCNAAFLWVRPYLPVRLETWLIVGYGMSLLLPIWGLIGLANVNFGWKMRWEFYAVSFVSQLSQAFANTAWKVLFSELIPAGSEIRWLTLQVVLSCVTVWVNYVASAPLQNATHQLRFPLIISLIFLCAPVILELARCNLRVFAVDREKWIALDNADVEEPSVALEEVTVTTKHA